MEPYKPWDFCNDIHCRSLAYPGPEEDRRTFFCEDCKAYKMHQYLKDNGQILEEGNPLLEELERLQAENEQLKSQPVTPTEYVAHLENIASIVGQ